MINLDNVSHYLGMEVDIDFNKKIMTFQQSIHLRKIQEKYEMIDCLSAKISISRGIINFLFL